MLCTDIPPFARLFGCCLGVFAMRKTLGCAHCTIRLREMVSIVVEDVEGERLAEVENG